MPPFSGIEAAVQPILDSLDVSDVTFN